MGIFSLEVRDSLCFVSNAHWTMGCSHGWGSTFPFHSTSHTNIERPHPMCTHTIELHGLLVVRSHWKLDEILLEKLLVVRLAHWRRSSQPWTSWWSFSQSMSVQTMPLDWWSVCRKAGFSEMASEAASWWSGLHLLVFGSDELVVGSFLNH